MARHRRAKVIRMLIYKWSSRRVKEKRSNRECGRVLVNAVYRTLECLVTQFMKHRISEVVAKFKIPRFPMSRVYREYLSEYIVYHKWQWPCMSATLLQTSDAWDALLQTSDAWEKALLRIDKRHFANWTVYSMMRHARYTDQEFM